MFTKILSVVCLASFSIALEPSYQHATSFASFNDNHNTVQHIQSSPNLNKPSSPHYSSPNLVHSAPSPVYSGQLHSSAQFSSPSKSAPESQYQFSSSSSGSNGLPGFHGASSGIQYSAPVVSHAAPFSAGHHQEEEYGPAQYEFAYGVEDHHTGDIHSHKESRQGDKTQGEYSLHEADGTIRTVRYNVDGHSGFNAVVDRSGHLQQQH